MTNENYNYVKAMLYCYPHLKTLCAALEDSILNKAVLSFRYDTLAAAERITEEIFLKNAIARLENDLTKLLRELKCEERYLLDYKYFHKKGAEVPLCFSERSYYRRQHALLASLRARLIACGWTEEAYLNRFKESVFFMKVYKAVCDGEERKIVNRRAKKTLSVS